MCSNVSCSERSVKRLVRVSLPLARTTTLAAELVMLSPRDPVVTSTFRRLVNGWMRDVENSLRIDFRRTVRSMVKAQVHGAEVRKPKECGNRYLKE